MPWIVWVMPKILHVHFRRSRIHYISLTSLPSSNMSKILWRSFAWSQAFKWQPSTQWPTSHVMLLRVDLPTYKSPNFHNWGMAWASVTRFQLGSREPIRYPSFISVWMLQPSNRDMGWNVFYYQDFLSNDWQVSCIL